MICQIKAYFFPLPPKAFKVYAFIRLCISCHDQVQGLKKELEKIKKLRKEAYSALKVSMQKAAQLQLLEKEKNKSPSYAMRISVRINQAIWSMLQDGKSIAEVEINDMVSADQCFSKSNCLVKKRKKILNLCLGQVTFLQMSSFPFFFFFRLVLLYMIP